MPDGETFKKLNKGEAEALERYYKRQGPDLTDIIAPKVIGGLPIIIGTAMVSLAYIFREQLQDSLPTGDDIGQWFNEGLWDNIVFPLMDLSKFKMDPTTPENVLLNPDANPRDYRYAGPLTRCQRWETDLVDLEARGVNGLSRAFILRRMKDEGCDKPGFVEAGEWGRIG